MYVQTDALLGKTISHYKITEFLGGGGMGVVFKAEDIKLKRTVALKFLPTELTRDADIKERFMHEAQAASALDHPRIGTIYEIDETEDGGLFIAMAYYDGVNLKNRIDSGIGLLEAVEITMQVAGGLSKTHQQGIVHRDIKPANIMITSDGYVKIVDFGLAKLSGGTKLTKTGTTMGTPSYMSPEQVKGLGVDHRTDIWALGVILYEMVTGQLPFKGDHEMAVLYNIVNAEPEPVNKLNAKAPASLSAIIVKALTKEVDSRYASLNDMLSDLNRVRIQLQSGANSQETVLLDSAPPLTPPSYAPAETKILEQQKPAARKEKTKVLAGSPPPKKSAARVFVAAVFIIVVAAAAWFGYNRFVQNPGQGYINLESNPPGAMISLNDQATTRTTPAVLGPLTIGEHKITLTIDGYEPISASFNLSGSDTLSRVLDLLALSPATGNLFLTSQPEGAKIVIGNKLIQLRTPARIENLSTGEHSVQMELEGYENANQMITISANETDTVDFRLEPIAEKIAPKTEPPVTRPVANEPPVQKPEQEAAKPGSGQPAGPAILRVLAFVKEGEKETQGTADVFIDGRHVGQTPIFNHEVQSGAHTVTAKMFNHLLVEGPDRLTLAAGQKQTLKFIFEKL
jgi:serine/threonine protein kinase